MRVGKKNMKYRTKEFVIEAIQYTGNYRVVTDTLPDVRLSTDDDGVMSVWDYLQNTWVPVNLNDFIIKGMKGEFYPCDPEVFHAKYESIEESPVVILGDAFVLRQDGTLTANKLTDDS